MYEDLKADPNTIATELAKLKASFPAIDMSYISVLSERIQSKNFSEQRLKDAIADVIDNFKFKVPNIADIVSFDKKIKLYTYNEAYLSNERGETTWEDFKIIERNGIKYRVKLNSL